MEDFLYQPWVAVGVAVLFVTLYFAIIGSLAPDAIQNFFHIGPATKDENRTTFIGMNIDTWGKTVGVYVIAFFSSWVWSLYSTYGMALGSYSNRAIREVSYSKQSALIFLIINPLLCQLMGVVMFFTSLTTQFQFIFFEVLGGFLGNFRFNLKRISEIKFDVPTAA